MEPTYLIYRAAARRVRQGWTQGEWYDLVGNPCMVQAIIYAAGIEGSELPEQMQLELDSQLTRTKTYCTTRAQRRRRKKELKKGATLQQLAIGWNDEEGRSKEEVADFLDALADRLEREQGRVPWNEVDAEIERLWIEHHQTERMLELV